MKAFVTGGTGFMGSAIVRELLATGYEVRALVRENSDTRNLDGLDIERVRGDLRDEASIRAGVKGCQHVYHAGAMVAFWVPKAERSQFTEVNVEGTKRVLAAALDFDVERVIYTSTVSTIGSFGKEHPTTEEHSFNMWDMSMEYERSKYSAEFEAWRFAARGLPLVTVLPAAPVGSRDIKPNPVGRLILDFLGRNIPGYIEGGGNFIDVEDVALGHVLAASRGKVGERYLIGHANVSVSQLFALLEDVSGVKAPTLKLPFAGALGLAHLLTFLSDNVTNRHPLLTPPLAKMASQFYFIDSGKAEKEIGFTPRSDPKKGAIKAIRWFLDNGYVKLSESRRDAIRRRLDEHNALLTAA